MTNKLAFVLTILLLLTSKYALATKLNMGERIQINSEILNEAREIQVLLPENYHSNTGATYPVIYLLDGDFNIHGVSGMLDLLSNKGQLIPDVILVAIADKGTDKYRQYMTPKDSIAPFKKDAKGNAELFLAFLEREVKPYLSKHYRTANNTILVGHSMGGLFVLNALLESPSAFNNYVAISPSVWLSDHALTKKAKVPLEKSEHEQVALYLSLADETRMGVYGFMHLLDEIEPKHINWHFTHYPNENHNSVGIISLRDNLKKIFNGWFISNKKLLDFSTPDSLIAHYKSLSTSLNIEQPIPTQSIQSAIKYFYKHKKSNEMSNFMAKVKEDLPSSEQAFTMMLASYVGHFDSPAAALKVLQNTESRFKDSIEYLKSIAAIYGQLKNSKMAYRYYEKALVLAKKYKANQWQINVIEAKLLAFKH